MLIFDPYTSHNFFQYVKFGIVSVIKNQFINIQILFVVVMSNINLKFENLESYGIFIL